MEQALERWFPDYCRAHELKGQIEVKIRGPLSEAMEHQLFLIIQEGMANIVKHASAHQITLSLVEREHQYTLQLQDNGQGFERNAIPTTSHGLSTMRERAQKLGGNVEVFSKVGSGTRVSVRIPKFASPTEEMKEEGREDE
ncbi:Sensor histidine kinase LiaS [compost metagenome]